MSPFSSDLLTFHFDGTDHTAAYMEISSASLSDGVQFGVTALEQGGEFSHFQTTDGSGFVWMMRLAKDQPGTAVELLRVDLSQRVIDDDFQNMWSDSRLPGLRHRLPIIGTNSETIDGTCSERAKIIDASSLVKAGFFAITSWFSGGAFSSGATPAINIDTAKRFQHNIDFTVIYSSGAMENGARLCVYSLPSPVMIGRRADDRAGYFFEPFRLLGDYSQENWLGRKSDTLYHPTVKLINRMQVPNSRCSTELGRDASKLHFYVDPTTPTDLWEATVAGINMWNVAFEGAGHGVVAHKPDDPDWPGAKYDNADICFNTISWAAGSPGSTFAIGQSVKDPRSGEVLKANIIFTLGWLEIWMGRRIVFGAMSASQGLRTEMRRLGATTTADADWDVPSPNSSFPEELRDRSPQLWSLIQNPSPQQSLAFLQAGIKDVTAHEVGHTIGLRHNFRGTISIRFDDAHRTSTVNAAGLTASVMDYNGFPFVSKKKRQELKDEYGADVPDAENALYFTPVVGAYDKWVIRYGYTKTDEETNGDCNVRGWCLGGEQLQNIAAEYDEADFSYATDATRDDFDPYTVLRDLTSDPIRWYGEQFEVGVDGLDALFTRTMEDGLPFTDMHYPFRLSMRTIHSSAEALTRFIGGVKVARKHDIHANCTWLGAACSSQGNTPVSEADQGRALGLILDSIVSTRFDPPAWYQKEATEVRTSYSDLYELSPVNVADYINTLKMTTFAALLSKSRLQLVRMSEPLMDKGDGDRVQWLLGQISAKVFSTDQTLEGMRTALHGSTQLHNVRAEYLKVLTTYDGTDQIVLAAMKAEADVLKQRLTEVLALFDAASTLEKFFVSNQIATLG